MLKINGVFLVKDFLAQRVYSIFFFVSFFFIVSLYIRYIFQTEKGSKGVKVGMIMKLGTGMMTGLG